MSNRKHLASLLALLTTTMLAACVDVPGPQESQIAAPDFWNSTKSVQGVQATEIDQSWWAHFDDPVLNGLVSEALENNKNLQIAQQRVAAARADREFARSALFPQLNATADASRGNQGYYSGNKTVGLADANLSASWELDLFGRNQAATAQAAALIAAAEADRDAVRVGLLAELARNYFDLRHDQRQIALTRQNLATQQDTLRVTRVQLQGAIASEFDVQRAAAQVSTTEALIPSLQSAEDAARNRITSLLGLKPGSKDAVLGQDAVLKPLDQHILIAAPAVVIAARPDVRAAERRFAASISAKDVATRALLPDISLTALFGQQTATPFSSTPFSVGGSLVLPILNFGRLESRIDAADAQQKQAFLTYQQIVLEALENMENVLSAYLHEAQRNAALTSAEAQNRKAVDLARRQYSAGYVSLLDVLVAERSLLDAQSAKTGSDLAMRVDLANVYAAAGGGWRE